MHYVEPKHSNTDYSGDTLHTSNIWYHRK